MQRVTTREFQRDFGRYQDEALKSPLAIMRHGRERLVVLSASEYKRFKRLDRSALAVEDLSAAELEAIRKAKPPAKARLCDHELVAEHGGDT